MTKTRRVAAMMMAAAMGTSMIGVIPAAAEEYINIGSLYLCSAVFLPLGLAPHDAFWSAPDEEWSAKKVWAGGHIVIDHAQD